MPNFCEQNKKLIQEFLDLKAQVSFEYMQYITDTNILLNIRWQNYISNGLTYLQDLSPKPLKNILPNINIEALKDSYDIKIYNENQIDYCYRLFENIFDYYGLPTEEQYQRYKSSYKKNYYNRVLNFNILEKSYTEFIEYVTDMQESILSSNAYYFYV